MRSLQGHTRVAFLAYFLSHIFFTLVCDLQAILKPVYPKLLQDLISNYAATVNDPHMAEPFDLWFQSLVFCEMFFQLPFFFVAVYMMWDTQRLHYPKWFQMLSIVYGTHVATTLVPLFPTILIQQTATTQQQEEPPLENRLLVLFLYLPYFVFPVCLAWIAATDDLDEHKHANASSKKVNGSTSSKDAKAKGDRNGTVIMYFCGFFLLVAAVVLVRVFLPVLDPKYSHIKQRSEL